VSRTRRIQVDLPDLDVQIFMGVML